MSNSCSLEKTGNANEAVTLYFLLKLFFAWEEELAAVLLNKVFFTNRSSAMSEILLLDIWHGMGGIKKKINLKC